jgi:glycosyltransferase involved in cell wall biosynthesis
MKIVFFGADYPPTGGGIATYSYEFIENVKAQSKIDKVDMLMFDNKNVRFLDVGYKIFKFFLRNRDFDIYHSLNLFPVGFWVVFWGKIFRKKTIVTFYGTDANDTSASGKTAKLKGWTLRNASSLITISEFTKKATEKKYSLKENKIKVIYPTVPKLKESSEKINIPDDAFVIVSVARLVKRKGIEFLVRAVSQMKDQNVKVFIIGDGKERDNLVNLVSELKLQNQVSILGKVLDIVPYYRRANVACLVSYNIIEDGDFEGLGLVLLEAQSYGVPVIGSQSGGIPEALLENVTGLVVKPRDVDSLANVLLRLRNDKDLARTLSSNTKGFLEKRFGVKNTIEKYIELCNGL